MFGPSLKPNSVGHLKFGQLGFKGFSFGFSLKPKTAGRLKLSCKAQVFPSMASLLVG